jgi:hypothetical protein
MIMIRKTGSQKGINCSHPSLSSWFGSSVAPERRLVSRAFIAASCFSILLRCLIST